MQRSGAALFAPRMHARRLAFFCGRFALRGCAIPWRHVRARAGAWACEEATRESCGGCSWMRTGAGHGVNVRLGQACHAMASSTWCTVPAKACPMQVVVGVQSCKG